MTAVVGPELSDCYVNAIRWLTNSISTGTSRVHTQGMITLIARVNATPRERAEVDSQRSHAHDKPEILLPEDVPCTQVPCLELGIVRITENGKYP